MSVGHTSQPCKNGSTDQDPVAGAANNSRGHQESRVRWRYTAAPPSEYDGMICAAAMRSVATPAASNLLSLLAVSVDSNVVYPMMWWCAEGKRPAEDAPSV